MVEVLHARPEIKKLDRPRVWEIEAIVDPYRVSVGEHEYTHVFAIWGVGKSTHGATVEPSADYEGATFPPSDMSVGQMQIAAMASADHTGNGSDRMKAHILQNNGGMSVGQAEHIAKSIVSNYTEKVKHYASIFLANKGTATDCELRQFIRWAEEDIRDQKAYGDLPIPPLSDDYEERRKKNENTDSSEVADDKDTIARIIYERDGIEKFILNDGSEKIWCRLCQKIDGHSENCPNNSEKWLEKEYVIFDARSEQNYFSPN